MELEVSIPNSQELSTCSYPNSPFTAFMIQSLQGRNKISFKKELKKLFSRPTNAHYGSEGSHSFHL
jgi:hypothetical protein